MKKVLKKAMSVLLLLGLTVTLNAGVIGTLPPVDEGGISVLSDEPSPSELHF
ncbi:MAG: hypothetical protein K2O99_04290 [Lachnospiraceae bacterium]|nr:hypothetical protein [Lachnospiraceae bacterium]